MIDTTPVVGEFIISFPDAMKVIKELNKKKHRHMGFHYELIEINDNVWSRSLSRKYPKARVYSEDYSVTFAYYLKVFRASNKA